MVDLDPQGICNPKCSMGLVYLQKHYTPKTLQSSRKIDHTLNIGEMDENGGTYELNITGM